MDEMNYSLDINLGATAAGPRQDCHELESSKPRIVPSGGQVQPQGFANPAKRIEQELGIRTVSREGQKDGDGYKTHGASDKQPFDGTTNTPVARNSPSEPTHGDTSATAEVRGQIHETNSTESPMVEQPATEGPNTADKPLKEDMGAELGFNC